LTIACADCSLPLPSLSSAPVLERALAKALGAVFDEIRIIVESGPFRQTVGDSDDTLGIEHVTPVEASAMSHACKQVMAHQQDLPWLEILALLGGLEVDQGRKE
jgi:hypothetical protein